MPMLKHTHTFMYAQIQSHSLKIVCKLYLIGFPLNSIISMNLTEWAQPKIQPQKLNKLPVHKIFCSMSTMSVICDASRSVHVCMFSVAVGFNHFGLLLCLSSRPLPFFFNLHNCNHHHHHPCRRHHSIVQPWAPGWWTAKGSHSIAGTSWQTTASFTVNLNKDTRTHACTDQCNGKNAECAALWLCNHIYVSHGNEQ